MWSSSGREPEMSLAHGDVKQIIREDSKSGFYSSSYRSMNLKDNYICSYVYFKITFCIKNRKAVPTAKSSTQAIMEHGLLKEVAIQQTPYGIQI